MIFFSVNVNSYALNPCKFLASMTFCRLDYYSLIEETFPFLFPSNQLLASLSALQSRLISALWICRHNTCFTVP